MKKTQGGLVAAVVAIAAAGGVGVAGADQGARAPSAATIYTSDENGGCFTTNATPPYACESSPPVVNITTGQTVDFAFPGNPANAPDNNYNGPHNAVSNGPNWTFVSDDASNQPRPPATTPAFNEAGDYAFVCGVHPFMTGTIHVTGPTITPTPSATATPTPTPTTHPGGSTTPPPSGGDEDTIRPRVRSLRLKALRHAARVTFRLSEPATVTIRVKRAHKIVKTVRKQVAAGKRTVTIRSKKLKKGRYTIVVLARDAFGNRSVAASKSLRIKR